VRDGWVPYRRDTRADHQTCVAHLLPRCDGLIADLPGSARHTPRQVKDLSSTRSPLETSTTAPDPTRSSNFTERVDPLGEQAHAHGENRKLVTHLLNERDAQFTFLARPDIDATNWRAEQTIRPAVVTARFGAGTAPSKYKWARARLGSVLVWRSAAGRPFSSRALDALTRDHLGHVRGRRPRWPRSARRRRHAGSNAKTGRG
jgi:transposase